MNNPEYGAWPGKRNCEEDHPLSGRMLVFDALDKLVRDTKKEGDNTPTTILSEMNLEDGIYTVIVLNCNGRVFKQSYRVENPKPRAKVTPIRN